MQARERLSKAKSGFTQAPPSQALQGDAQQLAGKGELTRKSRRGPASTLMQDLMKEELAMLRKRTPR